MLLTLPSVCHALTLPTTSSGITATVDPAGDYTISTTTPAWKFAGSLGAPVSNLTSTVGSDHIGGYVEATFDCAASSPFAGSIRVYHNEPVVQFSVTLPQGGSSIASFPNFTEYPQGLRKFSYRNQAFSPYSFSLQPGTSPWALFDSTGNTFIVSPASDFFISKMSGDGETSIASGLNDKVGSYPAGFTHRSLLVVGKGIVDTFQAWGNALTSLYGKSRPSNEADISLKYLGYWTDHYAYYYYQYDHALGYTGTLLDLDQYFHRQKIPVKYFQLDSWWYPKSKTQADGRTGGKMNPHEPDRPWNRGGGCLLYQADGDLFTNGLGAFEDSLKLPLLTHARWIDWDSPYRETYKISGVAAIDRAYWDDRAKYLAGNGVVTYEQDWLDEIYDNSPALRNTVDAGNAFMDNMSGAMSSAGLTMQYCMPMPLHYLQGAKYDNLTTVRVSDDGFNSARWDRELYTSVMAGGLGEWPWTDVFSSSDTGSMLLSVLTAGPVGISDEKGAEDIDNIRHSVRADGRIVKPDLPAVPTDATFVAESGDKAAPMVAWTDTVDGRRTDYLFCQRRGPGMVTFAPSDLGIRGPSFVYNYFAHTGQALPAGSTYIDRIPSTPGFNYYVVAPIDAGGIAFLGDSSKFVGTGKSRIARLSGIDGHSLKATVLIAPGDGPVIVDGFAVSRPSATSSNGRLGAMTYDESKGWFSVTVQPAAGAQPSTIDGDRLYAVDVTIDGTDRKNFALGSASGSLILRTGSSVSDKVGNVPLNGFDGHVDLSTSNLPPGVTASFSRSGDSATLTLTAAVGAAPGDYTVMLSGIRRGLSHSLKVPVRVVAPVSSVFISCGGPAASPFIADDDFDGGTASDGTSDHIDTSAVEGVPQSVWQHGRWGDFSYVITDLLPDHNYDVRLDFDEFKMRSAGRRQFTVSIDGKEALHDFDIYASAGGYEKAIARSFKATADGSGQIVVRFEGVVDNAMVQGIEVTARR